VFATILKRTLFARLSLAILLGVSSTASAQKTTVIRVVIVKTDNPTAYAQALEEGKAIIKKAGITETIMPIRQRMPAPILAQTGKPCEPDQN
jgi:hypothetical protein